MSSVLRICSEGGGSTLLEGSWMLLQRHRGVGMLGQTSCPV